MSEYRQEQENTDIRDYSAYIRKADASTGTTESSAGADDITGAYTGAGADDIAGAYTGAEADDIAGAYTGAEADSIAGADKSAGAYSDAWADTNAGAIADAGGQSADAGGQSADAGGQAVRGMPAGVFAEVRQREGGRNARMQRREKAARNRLTAAALVACMLLGSVFGYVGAYVYDRNKTVAGDIYPPEVMYQSVVRTAASGAESDRAMSAEETASIVKQAVVEISTETTVQNWGYGQSTRPGAGSGVIVTTDGYIVTNYHVIDGADNVDIRLPDGTTYPAVISGSDADLDLAVLKINASGLTPAVLGNSELLRVGETALAVGNPLGELGGTVTLGIISALDREIEVEGQMMTLLQTDAAINLGNSGGGLFNLYGELIGIINAKSMGSGIEGLGFAIPVNAAKAAIEDLITYGYVRGRVSAGLEVVDIRSAREAMRYQVSVTGLYIVNSRDGQLINGDRIIGLNDYIVSDFSSFKSAINSYKVGDTVAITVMRGNDRVVANVVLTEMTPGR